MQGAGGRVSVPFDLANGAAYDLGDVRVVRVVANWICCGLISVLWLAVPCTDDSVASQSVKRDPERVERRASLLRHVDKIGQGLRSIQCGFHLGEPAGRSALEALSSLAGH